MKNLSSVNLATLDQAKTGAADALKNLATFADAPLRLQKKVENGVTVKYLGVRTWSTYFLEKIWMLKGEKALAKLKTQKAIDQYVRPFLNNPGIKLGCSAESLTATLQSKVLGKLVLPASVVEAETKPNGEATTRPTYEKPEVIETKGKKFSGTGIVPTGLSVAVISPLQMIADVRLVAAMAFDGHPKTDTRRGATYRLSSLPDLGKHPSVNDFKKYYLDNLNCFEAIIQTSLVMELQLDSKGNYSEANLEGATSAIKEFARLNKVQGKHVSVMLTVPSLPNIDGSNAAPAKVISAGATAQHNNVLVPEPESDSSDDSDSD